MQLFCHGLGLISLFPVLFWQFYPLVSVLPLCFLCCLVFPPFLIALIVSTCSPLPCVFKSAFPFVLGQFVLSMCFVHVPVQVPHRDFIIFFSSQVLCSFVDTLSRFAFDCIYLLLCLICSFPSSFFLLGVIFVSRIYCNFQFSDSFVSDQVLSSVGVFLGPNPRSVVLDAQVFRLYNTSPPAMIAVSRPRSLYQRLHNDIKDRLAVYSQSLHTSANATANLLR